MHTVGHTDLHRLRHLTSEFVASCAHRVDRAISIHSMVCKLSTYHGTIFLRRDNCLIQRVARVVHCARLTYIDLRGTGVVMSIIKPVTRRNIIQAMGGIAGASLIPGCGDEEL